ncbi:glucose PTS transporter subunit IIA [Mycoplasmopsis ciconiae]|uniref:Glucose PTS transporter subunit IIA n=1 Tax=Mycoplasmopsis ciconiae TaxID=561067 RepID=A0ABU7MLQ4_9BACT|nr:glucose PTS transporter subunit IIA [Mycoplasmopsis ciconiae]
MFKKIFDKLLHRNKIEVDQYIREVVKALGGINNIYGFNNGATRLRYDVVDSSLVDKTELKNLGASEVLILGKSYVEVKFGENSEAINLKIREAAPELKKEYSKTIKTKQGNLAPKEVILKASQEFQEQVNEVEIFAPCSGKVLDLASLNDGVFSEKMLGEGFVVDISNYDTVIVNSPIDAKVSMIWPSKHAYGLKDKNGLEILIHIGINTTKMNGLGFESYVTLNQSIKKNQPLAKVDVKKIKESGYNPNVIVVLTNDSKFKKFENIPSEAVFEEKLTIAKRN